MEQWLRDLIAQASRGLKALIDAVWARLTWVYNLFINVFLGIRRGWDRLVNGARYQINKLLRFTDEVYDTLYWIVRVRIPQWVSTAVNNATHWLVQQITAARNFARSIVDSLSRWIAQRVSELANAITQGVNWLLGKINSILNTLRRVTDLVFTLLISPARFATWVFDALVSHLWFYLDKNADRIFTFVRQRSVHYTLKFADRLENMLGRLL